jgi:hypothetical protein
LAKFLNAWDGKPQFASLGGQKNFALFMDELRERDERGEPIIPDVQSYKRTIAKVIFFKRVHSLVRPMFQAFQGNVAIYLVSLVAYTYDGRIDLDRIWDQQDISEALKSQLRKWAVQVHKALTDSSGGRMISEWAKKRECWEAMQGVLLSQSDSALPEIVATR